MATPDPIPVSTSVLERPAATLLVMVAAMPADQFECVLTHLTAAFPAEGLLVATQNEFASGAFADLRIVLAPPTGAAWTSTAADFVNAFELAKEENVRAVLMLGPGSNSLSAAALRALAGAVLSSAVDLAVPLYALPPYAGLVNSAILYPLTRALFASRVRFPQAIDLCLSLRMAERLALAARRFTSTSQSDALIWPVNEAVAAGYAMDEFDVGPRALPQPADIDVNAILSLVTGSLFADLEAKAALWQRPRRSPPSRRPLSDASKTDGAPDVARMIESFRFAYTNLQEIWSLVLPPNSLLGLKRLSVTDAQEFRMPDSLWARIVFDFLIAYRLRTINRGHLLGALIPLYLGWVAGHINITAAGVGSERHIEAVASAFEADKPYMVSRWRWPDRFKS
jgi:glucosylglycerate synthase